jgi:hypothetical protein
MNTYEIVIGVFYDSHTTGLVEYHQVQAYDLFEASKLAWGLAIPKQGRTDHKREIVRIQRVK